MPVTLSPGAWLEALDDQLDAQIRSVRLFQDYYDGRHRLAFATAKFRQSFGQMFTALADNWCPSVVDSAVDRLTIWGFRFGDSEDTDDDAYRIFQANNLDSQSVILHTEAGKCGAAALMVSPPERDGDEPVITVEHPCQVAVAVDPSNRLRRLAALKRYRDDDEYEYATLYLPDRIYKYRSKEKVRGSDVGRRRMWVARPGDEGGANVVGKVPIVPILNKPTWDSKGTSDLITAIPLQDAINKELADMLVASEFAAFPQRVLMGVELPTDPTTGMPTEAVQLKAAVNRFWALESEGASISEFAAADLNNYVGAIALLLRHLSAQTRTPPHYLLGEIVNVSGDALVAAETGLTKRVERKQLDYSDGYEETMRMAFALKGNRANATDFTAETIWAPAAVRSEAQVWDNAAKMRAVGLPLEAIWAYAGFSPKQVKRFREMAGLPDKPPRGATTRDVPSVLGGSAEPVPTPTSAPEQP